MAEPRTALAGRRGDGSGEDNDGGRGVGTRPAITAGFVVIGVFFGVVLGWAGLAPLSSAAIAPGVVGVASSRKTVQHLEGGIVREILVREGERVEAGQALIRLDATRWRATLDALRAQRVAAAALEARLLAERDGAGRVRFPAWLVESEREPYVREAIDAQRAIFATRRDALAQQIDIMAQRTAQHGEQIAGFEGETAAQEEQLALVERELAAVRQLADKGLVTQTRLLTLERARAEIRGELSRNVAAIAAARQNIVEARLRVAELRTQRAAEVLERLREVQDRLLELAEGIAAAEDVLNRATVAAPLAGTVVNLRVHTPGGVIAPGQPILDIVPAGDPLVVEARLDPKDRDVVRAGLPAEIRFTAFSQRATTPVRAEVVSISADRLRDETAGGPYYLTRVELLEDPAVALNGGSIHPGMQAEVLIVTGKRTALGYLVRPLLRGLNRSLREE